jgi:catechol 2,3-dioxygenase-like lactoylglutathione lyase family enzyme
MIDIDNINHVGMAVRDLAATASLFEKLGFLLTPFSPHSGAWKPGGPVQSFASGNRCIMFGDNYLEILASEEATKPSPRIANFLERHQGAHIICFNTEHLESVERRLKAGGFSSSGIIPLQREIDTPDGVRTAKFERVQFAPEESAEGYIQAAKHLTPQYIYQARYIAHPNGCERLVDTIVVTENLAGFVRKYSGYLDLTPALEDSAAIFQLPKGTRLVLCTPQFARTLLPGGLLPPLPAIAGVSFCTPDLAGQRRRLQQLGLPFAEADGRLVVPAEITSGLAFVFEAKQ